MVNNLAALFPRLHNSGYVLTSPRTRDYNCIAWAAGDVTAWWWPDPDPDNEAIFWPDGVPREETLAAFMAAFATLGYFPCDNADQEPGFEKVALFAGPDGVPTHAARQLPSGRWTSKLGFLEDIEHALHDVSGEHYGAVIQLLKRPIPLETPTAD
jgi:hypothetical protein